MPTLSLQFPSDALPTAVEITAMTRRDTGAAVPVGVGAFTESGVGLWTRTFAAPEPGLTYDYTISATVNGVDQTGAGDYTSGEQPVTGHYITGADLLAEVGADELGKISDLTGDMTDEQKLDVQQNAVDDAEAEFDMLLSTDGITVPTTLHLRMVKLIVRKIAAYRLYTHVGDNLDDDVRGNNFKAKYDWAIATVRDMLANGAFATENENATPTGVFTSLTMRRRRSATSDEFSRLP